MNARRSGTSGVARAVGLAALLLATAPALGTIRTKVSLLNGAQEAPSNASPAIGCGRYEIDTVANRLTYTIAYCGLSGPATAAHFHGPAGPGVNAGVVFALVPGNPITGVWVYPEALEPSILGGNIYVNVHTAAFPGGEIRGQVVDMVAKINGAQEIPATATPASGYGLFQIDTVNDTLSYYIAYTGLAGVETAAHIHGLALHTANAGVLVGLPPGTPKIGVWTYPPAMEDSIYNGETYVNIHSSIFAGGEIRGQVVSTVAPIDPLQEVPPSPTTGCGCALVTEDKGGATLSYYMEYAGLTGPATAAHIHGFAPPGVNAGALHSIGTANPAINSWTFGVANQANVEGDLTYFNIHTAAFGGGEIRGQLVIGDKPCPADLNCDGSVGFADLLIMLGAWGPAAGNTADLDGNGFVAFADLLVLLGTWGPCP